MQRFKWLVLLCAFVLLWSSPGLADNEVAQVAQIGDTKYNDLASAVTAAGTDNVGTEIKLLADIAPNSTQVIEKDLTIDLNGHNITATGVRALWIKNGEVKITNTAGTTEETGIISANGDGLGDSSSVIRVGDGAENNNKKAKLTIGENVTVSTEKCYGVTVFGKNNTDNNLETADIEFVLNKTSKITVTSNAAAVSGNGSANLSATTITINGSIESDKNYAIYHPGSGTLTINGTVKGLGGIEAKGGEATIGNTQVDVGENATVEATATDDDLKHEKNTNGTSTAGFAIAAVNNESYKGGVKINIASGAIKGYLATINDDPSVEEGKKASITVSGGVFDKDPTEKVTKDGITAEAAATLADGAAVVKLKDNTDYPYAVTTAPTVSVTPTEGDDLTKDYTGEAVITLTATPTPDKVTIGEEEKEIDYTYQWYKKGESDENYTEVSEATNATLALINVADSAQYYCKVKTNEKEYPEEPTAVTVKINKAPASTAATVTGKTDLAYTGSAQDLVTVETGETTGGKLQYSVKGPGEENFGDYKETVPQGTNAGKYTIQYKVVADETGNYADSEVSSLEVEIAKAEISPAPTVTIEGWNYGESPKTPTVNNNSSENGAVTYTYKKKDADNDVEMTNTSDAGNYVVTATIADTDNYKGATATAEFEIKKATFTPTEPSAFTAIYGNLLSTLTFTKTDEDKGTWTWTDASATVGNVGSNTKEAKFTLDEAYKNNYEIASGKDTANVTITVTPVIISSISGIKVKETEYEYNGKTEVELDCTEATFEGKVNEDTVSITAKGTLDNANVGEYTVTVAKENITLENANGNYELANEVSVTDADELKVTITPKALTVTWSDTEFDYDGTSHAPSATVGGLVDNETGLSVTVEGEATEAGTHTATAKDLTAGEGATATASNYTLPENPTTTFTIKAAKLADDAITTEPKEAKTTTSETGASKTSKETTFTLKLGDGDGEVISVDVAITTDEVFAAKVNEKFSTLVSVDVSLDLGTGIAKDQFSHYVYSIDIVAPEWLNEKSGILSSDDVANGPYHHEFTLAGTPTTVKNDPIVFTAHIMLSSDNYSNVLTASVDKTVEFNVEKGTVVNPTVTIEGWTYGSSSNAPKVEGTNEGTYKITYKVKGADDSTSTDKAPTNAGDYTVTVVIPSTDDYEGKTVSADFTIAQLEAKLAWSATSFTYNSGDQAPTATVSNLLEGDVCAVTVTVSGDKATDGKAVNAGSYTATATALGNANYKLPENASIAFTIAKADITPSVTIADWVHGATASTPVISGNTGNGTVTYLYKSQSGTTAYESATAPTSAGSYTLTITIAETDNYNSGTAETSFKITGGTAPTEDNTGTGDTGETEKTPEELVEEAVNEDGTINDDVMTQLIENVATETEGELTPEDIAKNTAVVNVLANSVSNTNNTTNELNLSSIALTSTKGIAALLTAVQTGSGVNTSEMTLNLSKNSDLSQVSDLSGVEVKSLNLEGNTSVKTVDLKGATITGTLNMKGMGGTKGATETKATVDLKNAKVDTVDMSDSAVGTLTLDPSSDVKTIQASGSDLADINLAGNENIESLDISETEVTKLDAAGCAGLTNLTAAGSSNGTGKLKKIDISGCSSLTELTVSRNQLFGIKGHGLTSVRTFKARGQKVSNPSASTVFRRSMNFWEFLWNLWRATVIDDIANGNTDETDPGEYVEGTSSKDIAPFDVEDIASVYDPNNTSNDATPDADGMINFTTTPNGIKYDYVPDFPNAGLAGFITAADEDSENGMDVEVSDGTTEEEATLGNSSGGGCDAGFGLGALSALMLVFATLKKRR